jgi:hypothetical protein
MTQTLRLALLVSLGIHLTAAYLSDWLQAWAPGVTIRSNAPAGSSPQKPLSVRFMRPVIIPAGSPAEDLRIIQAVATAPAPDESSVSDPNQPIDTTGKSPDSIAPRFVSAPDFSFVESYPQKLSLQLTFRVFVSSAGLPERVEPVGSFVLPSELLEQITGALYRARFHPASQAGNSVASYLDIVIGIEPESDLQ